jgi:hypothetical protein
MFHSKPDVAEPAAPPSAPQLPPIPLSELERDLPAPGEGWAAHLAARDIGIVLDDLGRASVARDAARGLFTEHRANEARRAEHHAALEQAAIEADRLWRARLPRGLPWFEVPDGLHPATAMLTVARDEDPRRRSLVEDLDRPGGGAVFHSIQGEES